MPDPVITRLEQVTPEWLTEVLTRNGALAQGAVAAFDVDTGCGSGFWGGQRPSLAHYVTGMGPMDGATAAGGRSCCLSSRATAAPPASRGDGRRRRERCPRSGQGRCRHCHGRRRHPGRAGSGGHRADHRRPVEDRTGPGYRPPGLYRTIQENLFFGVGVVHVLGITAALLGWIGPIQAAVIHLGPDVLVFVNSVKLLHVRIEP